MTDHRLCQTGIFSLVVVLVGCTDAPRHSIIDWEIVDSAQSEHWHPMADSVMRYTVALHFDAGHRDTIDAVIQTDLVVSTDSVFAGIRMAADSRQLFRYKAAERLLETWPVPDDTWYVYHDLAISPDADHLAYVGMDRQYRTFGAVIRLGQDTHLLRGAFASGCDCDVDMNHARWISSDSFEIVAANTAEGGGWIRFSGHVRSGRTWSDTLLVEPDWHASER